MFKVLVVIGIVILIIIVIKIIKGNIPGFKNKKIIKEDEKEEEITFRDKRIAFLKSGKHKYIVNFAKLHKSSYKYFIEESELPYDENIEKKINKLKKLLERKGFVFDIKQLRLIIYDEIIVLTYEDFKSKILYHKPSNLNEYIKTFLDVYGEDYKEFINYCHFKTLLSEEGVEYTEYSLKDDINFLKRDLGL